MVQRGGALVLGCVLVMTGIACSKSSGSGDGGATTASDGGSRPDAGHLDGGSVSSVDAGCQSSDDCPAADYCSSGACLSAKTCAPNPSTDPNGNGGCAYQSNPSSPDYCAAGNCYCDPSRAGGVCLPVTPSCGSCTSSLQCGDDPSFFDPVGACVSYAPDGGTAEQVCLPTPAAAEGCPSGYVFGTGTYAGDCVPSGGSCGSGGICSSDADCDPQGGNPVCNVSTGTCMPACTFDYSTGSSTCPPGQVCNVDPSFLTSTNPNFGEGECGAPCNADAGATSCGSGLSCVADGPSGVMRCRPPPPDCIRDLDCPPSSTYHTTGDCDLATLTCVNGCSTISQCMMGYSCQDSVCAQESCVVLGGASAACDNGQFCCGESGGPSCPSGVSAGDCYDAPNPPWCASCTDGPIPQPPDNVSRPEAPFCAGSKEWISCDPTVFAQCPEQHDCTGGPTFCQANSDCGGNGMCQMAMFQLDSTSFTTQICSCSTSSQCPSSSSCVSGSADGGSSYCQSFWCDMAPCFQKLELLELTDGFVHRRSRFWWVLSAWVVAHAMTARADDVHYNDFPVGNRAMGLAGAFTAISNDPSGVYYNPAGLVGTTRTNVSVTTSLYGVESTAPQGLTRQTFTNLDLNVIPGEVGATYAVGEIKPGERAKAAWGFVVEVPSFRTNAYQQSESASGSTLTDTHSQSDQTLWAGLGGAYSLTRRLSIGLSAFYLHRTVVLNDRTTAQTEAAGYADQTTAVNVFDDSMLAIAGGNVEINDRWSVGASFSTPSVYVRSGGTVEVSRIQWGGSGNAAPATSDLLADSSSNSSAMKVRTGSNGGFRAGVAYAQGKTFTVAADVSGFYPVQYQRYQFQSPDLAAALALPAEIKRDMVVNFALGGEWRFWEHLSVAGGAYTDFSSAPPLPADNSILPAATGRNALPRDNLYGGAFAVGYFSDHSLTRVGITGVTGWGQNVQFEALSNTWVVQPLRETLAYLFVASTFRF